MGMIDFIEEVGLKLVEVDKMMSGNCGYIEDAM